MNATFPVRIASKPGLSFEINANGSLRRIDHGDVMVNLFPGNELEGGPANIHLRLPDADGQTIPLFGPGSPSVYRADADGFAACGMWRDLVYQARLALSPDAAAWFWHVRIENRGAHPVRCDLVHTQDLGIASPGAVRLNEYYVSQYIDHTPLDHPRAGVVVASRQNQSVGGRCPWTVIGSLGRAVSFATDALQFHGLAARGGAPLPGLTGDLPGTRLQHEHSLVCIQDEPFALAPGTAASRGFFGHFIADHPAATSAADLTVVDAALALAAAAPADAPVCLTGTPPPAVALFAGTPLLETSTPADDALERFFGPVREHAETADDRLLSFFTPAGGHVVLRAKEETVLRPHGHILRSGGSLMPDEAALTSTAWMNGVFHSMVTQGHVSINRFLSTTHSYLGLFRSHGQRVFVETSAGWRLLGPPSAFEMRLDQCRWIYQHPEGVIEVVSAAPTDRHELTLSLRILDGPPARFLISHHVALHGDDGSASIPLRTEERDGGFFLRPIPDSDVGRRFPDGGFLIQPAAHTVIEAHGDDGLLFADRVSRNQPFLCLVTAPGRAAGLTIHGRLVEAAAAGDASAAGFNTGNSHLGCLGVRASSLDWCGKNRSGRQDARPPGQAGSPSSGFPDSLPFWQVAAAPRVPHGQPGVAGLATLHPWLVHNALVHFLSPRGLEQYSGGGWGTRDVCQGPVELFLALGRFEPVRDLLLRVFRQQNPDGDWPQWFMFFERERNIRPGDSHGDIVYWPALALAQYLSASGDASILDETVPFFHPDGPQAGEAATIAHHMDRALELILRRTIAGTTLAAYGHGDWNDSLQPAQPEMRERLCSSWTVTLNYQTFVTLAAAMRQLGRHERAATLDALAANILDEFQRTLIVDDTLAGLAWFRGTGHPELLLHPRDRETGLSYSLLPMIHAIINDMFTPRQAEAHLALIRRHLTGPDGARLFDKPLAYQGGTMRFFQRAETATFFGREIGLMYTHAHLRYCEALHRHGDAEEFLGQLRRFNPIGLRDVVSCAAPRQANCYHSSSDAAFADRYDASARYAQAMAGGVPFEGGWRVYSSGAGIGARLIVQCLFGIRIGHGEIHIDPVLPKALDGLKVELPAACGGLEVLYRVDRHGRGPVSVNLNGVDLEFIRETNPYRTGGVRVSRDAFEAARGGRDLLTIWLE